MRTIRLYVPREPRVGDTLELDSDAANYLGRVLRLATGASIEIFHDSLHAYTAVLQEIRKKSILVRVTASEERRSESPLAIHLGLVMSKGDRMDYAVQKACELGVSRITPLSSEHCDIRLNQERAEKRRLHWQKVAISASEQSGRTRVTQISPVQTLPVWMGEQMNAELKLIAHPATGSTALPATTPASVILLVGPEGGFSEAEVAEARHQTFRPIELGPRILRTETAPLVAITKIQSRWGDLGPL